MKRMRGSLTILAAGLLLAGATDAEGQLRVRLDAAWNGWFVVYDDGRTYGYDGDRAYGYDDDRGHAYDGYGRRGYRDDRGRGYDRGPRYDRGRGHGARKGRKAGRARDVRIPRGHRPGPGMCRLWYLDVPPGRQPRAVPCRALIGVRPGPAAIVLVGPRVPRFERRYRVAPGVVIG